MQGPSGPRGSDAALHRIMDPLGHKTDPPIVQSIEGKRTLQEYSVVEYSAWSKTASILISSCKRPSGVDLLTAAISLKKESLGDPGPSLLLRCSSDCYSFVGSSALTACGLWCVGKVLGYIGRG